MITSRLQSRPGILLRGVPEVLNVAKSPRRYSNASFPVLASDKVLLVDPR